MIDRILNSRALHWLVDTALPWTAIGSFVYAIGYAVWVNV